MTKKQETIYAKLIDVKGQSALVEFVQAEKIHRVYLPKEEVDKLDVFSGTETQRQVPMLVLPAELAAMGIEIENPFAGFAPKVITSEEFTEMLHKHGVWTVQDAEKMYSIISGMLNAMYQAEYSKLIQFTQKVMEVK